MVTQLRNISLGANPGSLDDKTCTFDHSASLLSSHTSLGIRGQTSTQETNGMIPGYCFSIFFLAVFLSQGAFKKHFPLADSCQCMTKPTAML